MIKPLAEAQGMRNGGQTSKYSTIPDSQVVYGFSLSRFSVDGDRGRGKVEWTADVADQGKRDGPGNQCHVVQRSWGHPDRHTSLDLPNQRIASVQFAYRRPGAARFRKPSPCGLRSPRRQGAPRWTY